MNNIERFAILKELQAKKAALHKENFLEQFNWTTSDDSTGDNTLEKIISYGKTGLSLYRIFSKLTSKNSSQKDD